jgi:glucose-6-phosphate isomerase
MDIRLQAKPEILNEEDVVRYASEKHQAIETAERLDGFQGSLGWLNVSRWAGEETLKKVEEIADDIRSFADVFAVVGIGGSNQGARAVIDALSYRGLKGPQIIYPSLYLSAAEYKKILKAAEGKSLAVDVIAKNFMTLEPGSIFRMLRNYMAGRYGKEGLPRRIITTPTLGQDALYEISLKEGYRILPFPEDVGGRYSFFTPVGLLPAAVAGVDIRELVRGASDAQKDFQRGGKLSSYAKRYALSRNLLYEKGYDVEVMAFFEPSLEPLGKWWRQLFGESEGKGQRGIFPTVCLYTEELHSLGQYMQEGKRHVQETFFHVKKPLVDLPLDNGLGLDDGFDYLCGKTMNDMNEAAFEATLAAHCAGGVPCQVIEMDSMNEYNLGQYLYTAMRSCYYSALMLGVNPFDQPGVEAYKTEMFKRLK